MIFSKEKLDDMRARFEIIYEMQQCLNRYAQTGNEEYKDLAKRYGEMSRELQRRIDTADYTEREKKRNWIDRLLGNEESWRA